MKRFLLARRRIHRYDRKRAADGVVVGHLAASHEGEYPASERVTGEVREHIADVGGGGPAIGHGYARSVHGHRGI